jgi:hypothetical protein
MNDLKNLVKVYGDFEMKVQELINQFFGHFCTDCHDPCCRLDICEEAHDSLFLKQVRETFKQEQFMSDDYGWLENTGCCLKAGRAPVCSEYICDDILTNLPNPFEQYIAHVLCGLITYVGDQAAGDLNICEILHEKDFEKVDTKAFLQRLFDADEAFNAICFFSEHGKITPEMEGALAEILPIPPDAHEFCPSSGLSYAPREQKNS